MWRHLRDSIRNMWPIFENNFRKAGSFSAKIAIVRCVSQAFVNGWRFKNRAVEAWNNIVFVSVSKPGQLGTWLPPHPSPLLIAWTRRFDVSLIGTVGHTETLNYISSWDTCTFPGTQFYNRYIFKELAIY